MGTSDQDAGAARPHGGPRVRVDGKFFARGAERLRVRGVTYGPFRPDADGHPFPAPERVADDFARMRDAGLNALRTYHAPPEWLLDLADGHGLSLFLDVPWPKHLCFLQSRAARAEARRLVREAAQTGRRHPCLLAYSIGNEIPPNVARWHGAARVERFLAELRDVAKQADPDGLVTYANFPSTEYLDLSFLDFATFNVYLHDPEVFRRYLFRLQNLVGDKPLLLGEIGMDTFRHTEQEQADFLAGHVREATLLGLAGAFVFAWTDEWFTGGQLIEDWAFGITRKDRRPKPSCHALRDVFQKNPAELLPHTPRVSVVVCSYNGGKTLHQCLLSLRALNYPDYEVIVVDDGSKDQTPEVLARFPEVRAIRQPNHGLSVARNVGLAAATGSIVAYTDSDCFADPDWLAHLVHQLERSGAAAVGGPNLTPEDGRLAACVAASPGQPTHVLETDQIAEHIPGCNMAYRRDALLAISGFSPQYRKAGDDVDVCWRLQEAGYWITFAPGAFVWHHRRQNPRAYLKQQAGYGEAEALLRFQHPDRFTRQGHGKWRGVLYGAALQGLRLGRPIFFRGTFGTGLFQTIYRPLPAHWAMFPSTLEWHGVAVLVALLAAVWAPAWAAVAAMLGLSVLVAGLQAAQAHLPPQYDNVGSRCVVGLLCYLQPLVRSWARYRTRLGAFRAPRAAHPEPAAGAPAAGLPLSGRRTVVYWSEAGRGRIDLLNEAVPRLNARRCGCVIDPGWSQWDLEIYCHLWTVVRLTTVQEDHADGKRLVRVRYRMRLSGYAAVLAALGAFMAAAAALLASWVLALQAAALLAACAAMWVRGTRHAAHALDTIRQVAEGLGFVRCEPTGPQIPADLPAPDAPAPTEPSVRVVPASGCLVATPAVGLNGGGLLKPADGREAAHA